MLDLGRLREIVAQFDELTEKLCDPDLLSDNNRYKAAAQQRSGMETMANQCRKYVELSEQHDAVRGELDRATDAEMQAMFKEEFAELKQQIEDLEPVIRKLMLPKDPFAGKNVIVEIRPAAGGDEAAIFAGTCFGCIASLLRNTTGLAPSWKPRRPTWAALRKSSSKFRDSKSTST